MLKGVTYRSGLSLLVAIVFAAVGAPARAEVNFGDLSLSGYADFRAIAPPREVAWLNGGLSKFRYGNDEGQFRFAEAVVQGSLKIDDEFSAVAVLRGEPEQRTGIDMLEGYVSWHPAAAGSFSWSVKTGAFFPTISLENDDLGWTSPYTLTPSAINSWIGEELRTIGSEGTLRWNSHAIGTLSLTGALYCCNDQAGTLIADRGWAMDDNPTGLFERVRIPDETRVQSHAPVPGNTGMFDEIDGRTGWYAGASWQIPGIALLTVTRYNNQADAGAVTIRDQAWATSFWNFGARTRIGPVSLIAQQLSGHTVLDFTGGTNTVKFQSGFLLASTDVDDWRFSVREDLF